VLFVVLAKVPLLTVSVQSYQKTSKFLVTHQEESMMGLVGVEGVY
jgi:hypothetical protein